MNLKSLRYYSSNITLIFFLMAIFISAVLTTANYFYFGNLLLNKKYNSIKSLFSEGTDFSGTAKAILNSNSDITYVKLVNSEGVIQESFGNSDSTDVKELIIKENDGGMVAIGINKEYFNYPLMYPFGLNFLVTIIIFSGFIMILKIMVPQQKQALQKLNSALKNLKDREYDFRLSIDSDLKEDIDMIKVFDSFNDLADDLETGSFSAKPSVNSGTSKKLESAKHHEDTKMKEGNGNGLQTLKSRPEPVKRKEIIVNNDKSLFGNELPRKKVVALVSKINEYEKLQGTIDNTRLARFLTEFRKSGSAVISEYGGIVETLVNDEVVALFNVSENQDNPEMRAISAGVELLQLLANLNKENFQDSDLQISSKIGIYETSVPVSKSSGTPSRLGEVIEPARKICESTPCWKLNLAENVYNSVKQHVEVTPLQHGSEKYYSVVTVEEGVVNL